jgi:hypothetical protein
MITYGIKPPINAPVAWGCRAIQKEDEIEILIDRQDVSGPELLLDSLLVLLNLDEVRSSYRSAYNEGKLAPHSAGEVILIDNKHIKVIADTKGSRGYVYIGAHLKKHVHDDKLPPIGDIVNAKINKIGKCKVLYHSFLEANKANGDMVKYPYAVVMPINPPKWYRKSNPSGRKWTACGLIPSEIESLK